MRKRIVSLGQKSSSGPQEFVGSGRVRQVTKSLEGGPATAKAEIYWEGGQQALGASGVVNGRTASLSQSDPGSPRYVEYTGPRAREVLVVEMRASSVSGHGAFERVQNAGPAN